MGIFIHNNNRLTKLFYGNIAKKALRKTSQIMLQYICRNMCLTLKYTCDIININTKEIRGF